MHREGTINSQRFSSPTCTDAPHRAYDRTVRPPTDIDKRSGRIESVGLLPNDLPSQYISINETTVVTAYAIPPAHARENATNPIS